jgi:hypothetical protein
MKYVKALLNRQKRSENGCYLTTLVQRRSAAYWRVLALLPNRFLKRAEGDAIGAMEFVSLIPDED